MLMSEIGTVTTDINEFTRDTDGSRVTIMGVTHYGEREYYDELQDRLDERHQDGAAIHYELVGGPGNDTSARIGLGGITKALMMYPAYKAGIKFWEKLPHTVSQRQHLTLRSTWENHDMSTGEVMRNIKWSTATATLLGGFAMKASNLRQSFGRPKPIARKLASLKDRIDGGEGDAPTGMLSKFRKARTDTLRGELEDVLLSRRNEIALNAVDSSVSDDPSREVVMLWGQGHVETLSEGLVERGYRMIGSTALRSMDLDRVNSAWNDMHGIEDEAEQPVGELRLAA